MCYSMLAGSDIGRVTAEMRKFNNIKIRKWEVIQFEVLSTYHPSSSRLAWQLSEDMIHKFPGYRLYCSAGERGFRVTHSGLI